jgi:hypothetical protein
MQQEAILASYALKAQQQSARHKSDDEFLRNHQTAHLSARRALVTMAALVGGITIFAAAVQVFA